VLDANSLLGARVVEDEVDIAVVFGLEKVECGLIVVDCFLMIVGGSPRLKRDGVHIFGIERDG
jgi:hypothetical protein